MSIGPESSCGMGMTFEQRAMDRHSDDGGDPANTNQLGAVGEIASDAGDEAAGAEPGLADHRGSNCVAAMI